MCPLRVSKGQEVPPGLYFVSHAKARCGPAMPNKKRPCSTLVDTMNLEAIQDALRAADLDGWLFYDHHGRDPLAYRILGLPDAAHVTRRWYYFIPVNGDPRKLVHRIESKRLDSLPGSKAEYSSWQELETEISLLITGATRIAMQYSPRNAIMYVSLVDAGTIEVLRALGKVIVSSANLVSRFEAVLTEEQIASHFEAQRHIDELLEEAWREIGRRTQSARQTDEWSMVQWFSERLSRLDLIWDHGPNVSVDANSADSHYEPNAESSLPIRSGSFLLIDIWARMNRPGSCFYDITWTGVAGREPTNREQTVFAAVRDARNAAIRAVSEAFANGRPIAGFEADDAAREILRARGFAAAFTHRTGHNIGNVLHGSGAHLDNLETHDERLLLPNTCFSIEPGAYFPGEFGVRSEVDMITRVGSAVVSGRQQEKLVRV